MHEKVQYGQAMGATVQICTTRNYNTVINLFPYANLAWAAGFNDHLYAN